MSGVFKAVGKVFKKVAKVVKKVAIPALMIGAVVLTGGAALGALPAIGTVLGSVGISGTLASVLGGAISMGAVGAVTSGAMAGIQGKNIFKGAQSGFLIGAATGGLLGGLGMVSPNGVLSDMGIGSQSSHLQGLAKTGTLAKFAPNATAAQLTRAGIQAPAAPTAAPTGAVAPSVAAPGGQITSPGTMAADAARSAATATQASLQGTATVPGFSATLGQAAAPVASAGGGGLLSQALSAPSLLQLGGQVISGFAQGAAADRAAKEEAQALQDQYDRVARNYGVRNVYGTDKKGRSIGGVPIRQEMDFAYTPQELAQPAGGLLSTAFQQSVGVPYYQIVGGQVVQVGA